MMGKNLYHSRDICFFLKFLLYNFTSYYIIYWMDTNMPTFGERPRSRCTADAFLPSISIWLSPKEMQKNIRDFAWLAAKMSHFTWEHLRTSYVNMGLSKNMIPPFNPLVCHHFLHSIAMKNGQPLKASPRPYSRASRASWDRWGFITTKAGIHSMSRFTQSLGAQRLARWSGCGDN